MRHILLFLLVLGALGCSKPKPTTVVVVQEQSGAPHEPYNVALVDPCPFGMHYDHVEPGLVVVCKMGNRK